MKKLLFAATVALSFAIVNADIPANALGIRLNGGSGNGLEVSYQKAMGSLNRLELDLGWAGYGHDSWIGLAGVYQWWWNITGDLNWYAGPGAQVGFYSVDNDFGHDDAGVTVAIGGQVGIEYDFNAMGAPILLSLDVRPFFGFIKHDGFGYDGALSIRYTF